ncbi:aldo/keto reductase [Bifidobacterium vespertilionis]|uniref:Aldo/keto reductase n=1 Tax=Bifidobacterium vespertilionis TaxID=2562524 RepID=A0A5J5DW95_9BIFI|nr:aldo/keto reductase [Bifidobacterium vespertilionis]KAA8821137.1 aldo/keto reductase [Bifidobacterium vespertilionis]KAA8823631.1 aldo/keto reductase [Bifidobacterium vespertilionis]
METTTLKNGVKIPKIGYGVFQIGKDETARCVREAIETGYRHIDTAQSYFNESEVGDGIKDSGIDRTDLFVTTKVWIGNYGYENTLTSIDKSLAKLKTDYIDLVLLHQPYSDYYGAWHALEKLYREGVVRAIGVSNFDPGRVADMVAFNEIAPMVNQVETNPLNQQIKAHENMAARGVAQEAWAPFGEGRSDMFTNPTLMAIGEHYGKSAAQVILRWLTQRDIIALPKSTHIERMRENIDIFDFQLSDADMTAIAALDTATSLFFDHQSPEAVDMMVRLIKERAGRE